MNCLSWDRQFIRKQEGMVQWLGELRKGRRERIEKGSREGIEKETKREGGPERPPFIRILDLKLRIEKGSREKRKETKGS